MPAEQNMATVREWVEAINRNDVDAELACWQPDGEFVVVPTGVTYLGPAQLRGAGHASAALVGSQPVQGRKLITHLDAGAHWAWLRYDVNAVIRGPLIIDGIAVIAQGEQRSLVTKSCVVFDMRDGKLWRGWEYFDPDSMAMQLGMDAATLQRLYAALGAADTAQSPAPAATPAQVVEAFIQAWNDHDLAGLRVLLAPQVSGRNPLAASETTLSRDAVCSAIAAMIAAFPDMHMRIDTIVADGGAVAVEEFEAATLRATGTFYAMPVGLFIRVDPSGNITHMRNYWDTQTSFNQLKVTVGQLSQILTDSHASGADVLSWEAWRDAEHNHRA